jgi:hypothetical protein
MLPRARGAACAIGLLLAVAALVYAPLALAVFNKSVVGGPLTVASSTLAAAGNVSAAQTNCRVNKAVDIAVTWSATSSSYATSYSVERATASSGPFTSVGSVNANTLSYTDSGGSLAYSTTYYYRVTVAYRSWSTTSTVDSVKTLSKSCLLA